MGRIFKIRKMVLSKIFRPAWNLRYTQINTNPYLGNFFRRYQKPGKPRQSTVRTREHRKLLWVFNLSIFASVFGVVYLSVPFYKAVCAATGLVGDNVQRDYSASHRKSDNKLALHRKFKLMFKSETDPD